MISVERKQGLANKGSSILLHNGQRLLCTNNYNNKANKEANRPENELEAANGELVDKKKQHEISRPLLITWESKVTTGYNVFFHVIREFKINDATAVTTPQNLHT